MKIQFKTSEVLILLAASMMSFLANLPDSMVGNMVDKKWVLATLTALVVIGMFRYLQILLLLTITILAIGANIPSELAAALGVSQLALVVSLGILVAISLLNRVIQVLPVESGVSQAEIREERQAILDAISQGDKVALSRMLAMNKGVNFNHNGWTPLHLAAEKGNQEMMRMLISHGAEYRIKNAEGKTALEIAQTKNKFTQTKEIAHDATIQFMVDPAQMANRKSDADLWINPVRPISR